MKNEVSEKYRLYLTYVTVNNKRGYTVVDTDHDSDILLVHRNKILLFSSKELLAHYMRNYQSVFRKDRVRKWTPELDAKIKPYTSIDLNLDFYNGAPLDKKQEDVLMTTLGFIQDFAYQTNNSKLSKLLSNRPITVYREYHWNQYLWKVTNKDHLNELPQQETRIALEKLAVEMKSHVLVCNKANAPLWQTK